MPVAALVISILALLVSGAALYFAHRADKREAARRHAERAPTFSAEIETMNPGTDTPWYRLLLSLDAFDADLRAVEVEVLSGSDLIFTADQDGVDPASRPPRTAARSVEHLRVGDRTSWRVDFVDGGRRRSPIALLRVSAAEGDARPWVSTVPVDLPPPRPRMGRVLVM